jgi:hypothetical protein
MNFSIFTSNIKYFRVYACYLKSKKFIDYLKYRDVTQSSISNKYAFKNTVTIFWATVTLVLFSTMFVITSLTQVTGFADYNDTSTETTSNGAPHTVQEIAASEIVNSSIRNESNNTHVYYVTVLAPRTDDSIYSGIITFTATEPVRIEVTHGTSAPTYAINSNKLEHVGIHFNDKSIPASLILPNYVGNSFSYSIPFTGRALEFSYEKPFVAVYTVNAQVTIQKSTDGAQKVLSQEMPGAYFKASAGTLLIEVIPYLTVDTLQELPFSDLSSSDLSTIIDKVPVDSAQVILKKLPADKQQEILKGLSAEKRQEIGMLTTK